MTERSDAPHLRSCYLAGPMRGIPEYNFPAFFAAAKSLRERGIEVWSPAENDVHQDGFNPVTDTHQPMRHYMKRDLPAVLNADFVAVLPGWENSQGARLEVQVARACDIPVLLASDLSPVLEAATPKGAKGWEAITADHAARLRKHQGVPLLPDGCLVVMRSVNDEHGECVGHEIYTLPFPSTAGELQRNGK